MQLIDQIRPIKWIFTVWEWRSDIKFVKICWNHFCLCRKLVSSVSSSSGLGMNSLLFKNPIFCQTSPKKSPQWPRGGGLLWESGYRCTPLPIGQMIKTSPVYRCGIFSSILYARMFEYAHWPKIPKIQFFLNQTSEMMTLGLFVHQTLLKSIHRKRI